MVSEDFFCVEEYLQCPRMANIMMDLHQLQSGLSGIKVDDVKVSDSKRQDSCEGAAQPAG